MQKYILSFIAALIFPLSMQANELIIGVKGGFYHVEPDLSGIDTTPAIMISGQIGYEFLDLVAADIAVEFEAAKSITDVEFDVPAAGKDDQSILTGAVYLSARSAGPIYAIGRLGYARTQADSDQTGATAYENGTAIGAGVGFSTGFRGEVELTRYDLEDSDDTAYYLSLGFSF